MYGVGGERDLEEHLLDSPRGLRGRAPGADRQRRLQAGAARRLGRAARLRLPAHALARLARRPRVWQILTRQVEEAIEHWREPDRGIWEVRGEPKHFTSSKVFCWVACDRGARLAELREDAERAERVARRRRTRSTPTCCEHGVDERGVFVQHYDTDALDAALLLLPLMRFLPPDDERIRATVLAIADELTEHGLVLRYRTEETDDGLTGQRGHVPDLLLLARLGAVRDRRDRPRPRRCASGCSAFASPLGLYAEEIDPHTGRHLGNFPQAFTHLALINAVLHVIRADDQAIERESPWAEWR